MKITIGPTSTWMLTPGGVVARIWEGVTDDGQTRIHAIVLNVAVEDGPRTEAINTRLRDELIEVHRPFAAELKQQGFRLVEEE